MKRRINWLDFLKGIGIFLVVLGHVYLKCIGSSASALFGFIVAFHMPFYFMLSGILACRVMEKDLFEMLKKKSITLLCPFFSCGLAYALTFNELQDFIWGDFHSGYWFLLSLFICWFMFLPIAKMLTKIPDFQCKIMLEAIVLMIPFGAGKFVNQIISSDYVHALTFSMTFSYYRFFVVGYFVGFFYHNLKDKVKWNIIECICILIFTVLMLLILQGKKPANYISETGVQTFLSLSFAGICIAYRNSSPRKISNWIELCGRKSLSIYCFHYFVIKTININLCSSLSPFLLFMVASFVSVIIILVTMLIARPIEKNRYLSKMLLGK